MNRCEGEHDHSAHTPHNAMEVTRYEDAYVYSVTKTLTSPYDAAVDNVSAAMEDLSRWVDRHGGMIGHIKASLFLESKAAFLSNTGDKTQVQHRGRNTTQLYLTVIAFHIEDTLLQKKLSQCIESL